LWKGEIILKIQTTEEEWWTRYLEKQIVNQHNISEKGGNIEDSMYRQESCWTIFRWCGVIRSKDCSVVFSSDLA
jgi:hypothetical protein